MTATGMADKVVAALQALGVADSQFDQDLGRGKTARQMLVAFCEGIIQEIQTNARATGLDSDGDSHNLNIQ